MANTTEPSNGLYEESVGHLIESTAFLNQSMATLNQVIATLTQTQAVLTQNHAAFQAEIRECRARMDKTDQQKAERFRRIEPILLEHSRILKALPDAIRDKIGFKTP